MRLSHSIFIMFGLVVLTIGASVRAAGPAAPLPVQPGLSERIERRLIQFEMRIAKKGTPVRGVSTKDLDIELSGKPLKNFTLDDMCGDGSDIAFGGSGTRPGSSIFYFDEPELTMEGRLRAVEVAKLVAAPLIAHGHDILILRNGASVRAESTWTRDLVEVHAALDRLASDPGNRDYLSDAVDEQDVDRLIDQAKSMLGSNAFASAAAMNALDPSCGKGRGSAKLVVAAQAAVSNMATRNLVVALKNLVNDDLQRSGRDIERLQGAVRLLSQRGSPKGIVYFADTLRTNPGRVLTSAFTELANLDRAGSYQKGASAIVPWNEDGAMQSLVRDASSFGVRFYAVEGRGLTASSDWVRASQDTLASLALDTGGLSFVNGLKGSVIADRVAADQSCWYLVSFDPAGWDEDRPLRLDVWGKQDGLRISTASSVVIPSPETLTETRLLAAHFDDGTPDDPPLPVSIYPVGGTAKRLEVMAQVLLPGGREPSVRDTTWDVGFQVVSQGAVVSHTSNRVTWRGNGPPQVYQTTLSLPTGPYEIVVVARNPGTDSIRQGRIRGTWPSASADRVTLSRPAIAQPQRSGVVVDGEVKRHGVVVRGTDDRVDPREPVGIVTAACLQESENVVLRAERSLVGETEVSFAPMSLSSDNGRCVQIRDMVPAGALGGGRLIYVVRILAGDDPIVSQELSFDVADVSAVPPVAISAVAN